MQLLSKISFSIPFVFFLSDLVFRSFAREWFQANVVAMMVVYCLLAVAGMTTGTLAIMMGMARGSRGPMIRGGIGLLLSTAILLLAATVLFQAVAAAEE